MGSLERNGRRWDRVSDPWPRCYWWVDCGPLAQVGFSSGHLSCQKGKMEGVFILGSCAHHCLDACFPFSWKPLGWQPFVLWAVIWSLKQPNIFEGQSSEVILGGPFFNERWSMSKSVETEPVYGFWTVLKVALQWGFLNFCVTMSRDIISKGSHCICDASHKETPRLCQGPSQRRPGGLLLPFRPSAR